MTAGHQWWGSCFLQGACGGWGVCRAEVVLLGCWWQQYQGRLCRPTRVEGKGNSNFVLHTREVHHSESVSQWFLLEVEEPSNGNLLKGAFTKYFKEGFVVHGNKQVTAAQYKELSFVKGIGDSKGFSFH